MITFIVTLIALLALAITIGIVLLAGGAGVVLVFGDLIAFVLIIWLIVRFIRRRK